MTQNNSASGGYLVPSFTTPIPRKLTLEQFLQTVLVGLSEISGPLVRPKFQQAPPKQPDINVDWVSFGIGDSKPDANGYTGMNPDGSTSYQRHALIELNCGFHGPNALETYELVRDGFQIQQNLEALRSATMGFVEVTRALRVPELINERWFDRYEASVFLRRETERLYPVLSIVSAKGTIHTFIGNEEYLLNWQAPEIL